MNPRPSEIRIGAIVFHLSIGLLISIAGAQVPTSQPLAARAFGDQRGDPDSDEDGLSDFHEIHKHLTDPHRKDSGDDWMARREHAYTIRSVVRVMRPVDVAAMNDDFQDARLRRETEEFVEVEVIHYPFGTANQAIAGNPRWREDAPRMKEWLEPGLTSNWDDPMRKEVAALVGDLGGLDDKQVVEKAVPILLEHARYDPKGFTTFFTTFEGGKPSIPADILPDVEKECAGFGRTIEEQWTRDLFAKSMFEKKTRGSCTSTAIYLTACLRALGIPTRIVFCIPVVDATDDRQVEMVRKGVTDEAARKTILEGLDQFRSGWTSHTFNEVWVGGRWRRLNETRLGQPILDASALGLMTHVATFRDWADANAAATIGRRQKKADHADAFFGSNPYRAMAVDDHVGASAKVERPSTRPAAPAEDLKELTIDSLMWSDDPDLAPAVRDGFRGKLALLAHTKEWRGFQAMKKFTGSVDQGFLLEAEGQPSVSLDSGVGGVTNSDGSVRWVVLSLPSGGEGRIASGVAYTLRPQNGKPPLRWIVSDGVRAVRK